MIKHQASEAELSWRFACAGEAIGFSAQSYDFDEPRAGVVDTGKKLASIMDTRTARAVKAGRIDRSLARVSAEDRALFADVFTPRSVASLAFDKALRVDRAGYVFCVVGALHWSPLAEKAREQRKCEALSLQAFVEGLLALEKGKQDEGLVARMRDEVLEFLAGAVARYDEVRVPGPRERPYVAKQDREGEDRGLGAAPELQDAAQ